MGRLEEGKFADFIVLDEDPRHVPPNQISDINVLETLVQGKLVYQS